MSEDFNASTRANLLKEPQVSRYIFYLADYACKNLIKMKGRGLFIRGRDVVKSIKSFWSIVGTKR